ncbi:hypothetical protein [Streptomyces triculaminicus]|uniref:hypothetical protein n=1 Tax=Streptomyces triculaminicus TaxID=2816232 RepID=UPI0037D0BDE0
MNTADPTEITIRLLKRALHLLASEPNEQISYLKQLGVNPDEIALEFDDAFRRAIGTSGMGLLSKEVVAAAQPVDERLRQMTNSSTEVWTKSNLETSPEWRLLRSLAKEALAKISETAG